MANLFNRFTTTNGITNIYIKRVKVGRKVQKKSSSIGFIEKGLHHNVTNTYVR